MSKNQAGLSDGFLKQFKTMLLEEKGKLERELGKFAAKDSQATGDGFNTTFPQYGDKEDENAAEVADYAANLSIEQDLERLLRDVKSALERLEEGAYGICKYCHKQIEEKRLLARPTSSAGVECKKTIVQEA